MPVGAELRCTACAAKPPLVQRPDDNEATVVERLKVYEAQTRPLVDYYAGTGLLQSIDAQGQVDAITALLTHVLTTPVVKGVTVRRATGKRKSKVKAKAKAKGVSRAAVKKGKAPVRAKPAKKKAAKKKAAKKKAAAKRARSVAKTKTGRKAKLNKTRVKVKVKTKRKAKATRRAKRPARKR
jgi:adenylate kinase